jgi:chromosome segregation ATPase
MSQPDVLSFPFGGKKKAQSKNTERVKEALRDTLTATKGGEAVLTQLRDLLVGPHQRLSEARFEELLDILDEQDTFNRGKFAQIEAGLDDVSAEAADLRDKYDTLSNRIEALVQQAEAEKAATRLAFEEAMGKLRDEFDVKVKILSSTLRESLQDTEDETQRAIRELSASVNTSRNESRSLFERAQSASLDSLEQRIAQWRAEIEDERAEDMEKVAASLVDIGKKLLGSRKAPPG